MSSSKKVAELFQGSAPSEEQLNHAVAESERALSDPQAVSWLKRYYSESGDYAGGTFRTLEPNDPMRLTATDMFAITLLNVKVGPRATRRIFSPEVQAELTELLSRIPTEADLATADWQVWGVADEFYRAVKEPLGANPWVTASKLCARKRPEFFPIRDEVVTLRRLAIGRDWRTDWQVYKHLMTNDSIATGLRDLERKARADSAAPALDPLLKILDVLLWMSTPKKPRRG